MTWKNFENKLRENGYCFGRGKKKNTKQIMSEEDTFRTELLKLPYDILPSHPAALGNYRMFEFWCFGFFLFYKAQSL